MFRPDLNLDFQTKGIIACNTRGVKSMIEKYPELDLQTTVNEYLEIHNVEKMSDLSLSESTQLNIEVQNLIGVYQTEKTRLFQLENPIKETALTAEFVKSFGSLD
jgi:hypothetical protein